MFGPGEYVPDETLGITDVENLPMPKIRKRSRDFRNRPCPYCGKKAYRQRTYTRHLHDLANPKSQYTRRVVDMAVRLVYEDGLPYRAASWTLWRDHRVFVPWGTIQNWVEAAGKKGGEDHRERLFG